MDDAVGGVFGSRRMGTEEEGTRGGGMWMINGGGIRCGVHGDYYIPSRRM